MVTQQTSTTTAPLDRLPPRLGLAVVCALAATVNAGVLANGFVWDDHWLVRHNPWLTWAQLPQAFARHFWAFTPEMTGNYYRPLVHVLLFFARGLFGLAPAGFHALVLVGHVVASALVFALTRTLFPRSGPGAALIAGSVFAVHPVHSEAVAWVSGVADVTMAAAVLGAILIARREPESWGRTAAIFGLALAALLLKEPAIGALAVIPLIELAAPGRPLVERARRVAPVLAAWLVYAVLRTQALHGVPATVKSHGLGSAWPATALASVADYARMLLAPVSLNAFHLVRPAEWLDVRTLVGAVLVVGWAAGAGVACRRSPSVFALLSLAALALGPVLYLPAVGANPFCERYLYLPSAAAAVLVAVGLDWLVRSGRLAPAAGWGLAVLVLAAVVAGSFGSLRRNAVWRTELTLWADTVAKSPSAAPAWHNLGRALLEARRLPEARQALTRTVELDPEHGKAWANLGVAAARLEDFAAAEQAFARASQLRPGDPDVLANRCLLDQRLRATARALESCALAVQRLPGSAALHLALGGALFDAGNREGARTHWLEAQRLSPKDERVRRALARLGPASTEGR